MIQQGGLAMGYPRKVPLKLRLISLSYSLKVPLKLKIINIVSSIHRVLLYSR